jgi:hypothetical protein
MEMDQPLADLDLEMYVLALGGIGELTVGSNVI